jgi:indolepyruvate ferredoxin oxidoreductase
LAETFEGPLSLKFHLAPPVFAKRDAAGRLVKQQYGAWMRYAFKVLARFKFLRATAFDPFGHTDARRTERNLIREYRDALAAVVPRLSTERLSVAVEFARLPEQIRGFGHVKEASLARTRTRWRELTEALLHNELVSSYDFNIPIQHLEAHS